MPPRAQKPLTGIALVIDVGANIGEPNVFENSKKCASRIIERNIFASSLDQMSLILAGSEKSENELGYPNIEVKNKWLTCPNWKMLKSVESLASCSGVTGGWLDALIVSINLLKHESQCKRFTNLQVVLISNFGAPIKSENQIDDVIQTMQDMDMVLIVISPQGSDDVKTEIQKKNEVLVQRILEGLGDNGLEFDFDEAMSELGKSKKVQSKAAAWNVDLKIGEDISIPVTGYKKIAPTKPFSWKKTTYAKNEEETEHNSVTNTQTQTTSNGGPAPATDLPPDTLAGKTKVAVTSETVFFHKDDQIEKSDVIKGYLFGQTVVPFSDEDKRSLDLGTEKCLELICFTDRKHTPPHMYMGDSATCIVPKPGYQSSRNAVTALVKSMLELDRVGIVRKVYSKRSTPQVGALIPKCEDNCHFFYFVALPFDEDDRRLKLPSLARVKPTEAQNQAVGRLIDAMDLSKLSQGDPYDLKALPNPNKEHSFHQVKMKALYPECKERLEVSERVRQLVQPLPELLERAADALDEVKALFKLEVVEKKKYRREAAQLFDRSTSNVEDVEAQSLGVSASDFVQGTVTEVGTIDPVTDFLKLSEQGEAFDKLCEQMQTAIKKLVLMSSNTMGSQKPVSAMKLLRSRCVENNATAYNSFIASLKDDLAQRNVGDFWSQVVQEKLGLISCEEAPLSRISVDEAESFYEIKHSESQSEAEQELEAEELLNEI